MSDSPLVTHADAQSFRAVTRNPYVHGARTGAKPMTVFTGTSLSNVGNYSATSPGKLTG